MILDQIVSNKKHELTTLKTNTPINVLKAKLKELPASRDFKKALLLPSPHGQTKPVKIIAEVKQASPSRGIIRYDFDPVKIAQIYQESGAVAISVVTDKKYFQGDLEHLTHIKDSTAIPILNKDFIIDEYQLYQARVYGADAVLLIAAILTDDKLRDYLSLSYQLGLNALVEVHTLDELQRALATDAEILGINNRNLKNFQVSTDTTIELAQHIPQNKIKVSESGIANREMILNLQRAGIDAFLIGEALIKERDIGKKLRELIN